MFYNAIKLFSFFTILDLPFYRMVKTLVINNIVGKKLVNW